MGSYSCVLNGLRAAILALGGGLASAQPAPPAPKPAAVILERLADETQVRDVSRLLQGLDGLLAALPLEQISQVVLDKAELTLRFDFGKDSSVTRPLGGQDQWVLTKKGEAKRIRGEARTIRIGRVVRFTRDKDGLTGVRKGDLEVKWGLCWFDLSVTIERSEPKVAQDGEGRPLLELAPDGQPRKEGSSYVQLQANRWAVIEAKGRRVQVPLGLEPAPTAEMQLATAR